MRLVERLKTHCHLLFNGFHFPQSSVQAKGVWVSLREAPSECVGPMGRNGRYNLPIISTKGRNLALAQKQPLFKRLAASFTGL